MTQPPDDRWNRADDRWNSADDRWNRADDRWNRAGEFVAPPAEYALIDYGPNQVAVAHDSRASDVEFYEVPTDPAAGWEGMAPEPEPLAQISAAVVFLWGACALGALIGPFLTFGGYSYRTAVDRYSTSIDGWGRYSGSGSSGHGVIWGIPLIFCAALMAIAVLGTVRRRGARWPAITGLISSAALVAIALCVALEAEARASVAVAGTGLQTTNGAGLWITVVVGVAAAVGGLLGMRMVLDSPASPAAAENQA